MKWASSTAAIDTQAAIAQQRLDRDARFMLDSAYQSPRTMRRAS